MIDTQTGLPKLPMNQHWEIHPYELYQDPANEWLPWAMFRKPEKYVLVALIDSLYVRRYGIYSDDLRHAAKANPAAIRKAADRLLAKAKHKAAREHSPRKLARKERAKARARRLAEKSEQREAFVRNKHKDILGSYPPKRLEHK